MAHKSDTYLIRETRNSARLFVEQRHIAWVLFVAAILWGIYGYINMPKRKDPYDPVRDVIAIGRWPGMPTEKVEQFVTKKIEQTLAQNPEVEEVRSVTRPGESIVFVRIKELAGLSNLHFMANADRQYDDIKIRLDSIRDLPAGVLPLEYYKDFADTATLMLTVASPPAGDIEIGLHARDIQQALAAARAGRNSHAALVLCYPVGSNSADLRRSFAQLQDEWQRHGVVSNTQIIAGPGFVALDGETSRSEAELLSSFRQFVRDEMQEGALDASVWEPVVIGDLAAIHDRLAGAAKDKYTFHELDTFSDRIEKALKLLPQVSKVNRLGVLPEQVTLTFSQQRLASYGIPLSALGNALNAHNLDLAGASIDAGGKNIQIAPSGEFRALEDLRNVIINAGPNRPPVYLRDVVDIQRAYQSPERYLNFYYAQETNGTWRRARAVTLDVQMAPGMQVGDFGAAVNKKLAELKSTLPSGLILASTSDQPQQVREIVSLFMNSLWEAVGLVVLVAFIGFGNWRSALLLAISIPLTLAITFGMMHALGIDLQQVSIATLIIALGLLVDDPVVAGDAIQRELASGRSSKLAAWLGPTKLKRAIFFATITNIVAYLPFLLLDGDQWMFLFSLPVVITCSLIASRIVSMTFIPLLGSHLLKPKQRRFSENYNTRRFEAWYQKVGGWAIDHRWRVLAGFCAFLAMGGFFASQLKQQFFPKDLLYISYVDIWLPENASLGSTLRASLDAERVIRETTDHYAQEHPGSAGKPKPVLTALTTWVGGAGPRYWFTLNPEPRALNYAHILIQAADKNVTRFLAPVLQQALSQQVANARIDVHELEVGPPVGVPVAIRLSGDDIPALREYAAQLKQILLRVPGSRRVRDDWGTDALDVGLETLADRANLAGITNQDVATASLGAFTGVQIATLREGDKSIPIVTRLRPEERARLADLNNLYVYSQKDGRQVPLPEISNITYEAHPAVIRRVNQFRTITVGAFPADGCLPSEVLNAAMPQIKQFEKTLPPGMHLEFAGEYKETAKANKRQAKVLVVSVLCIFLVLVIQLRHAAKPLIVFSAVPFGIVGAFAALYIMRAPFGFMAFLGVTSLIGVIVSHIILLFDCVEERHEQGASLREALLDAGILRLRPVLITAGATVIAFFPLAIHGGPLWEPLCYTQIGGLTLSTIITLILVPAVYAIFVEDLKLVRWRYNNDVISLPIEYSKPDQVECQPAIDGD